MKKILSIAIVLFACLNGMAQKAEDAGRIAIAPFIPADSELPIAVKKQLENKLKSAVSKGGLSSSGIESRFIITPNIIEVGKEITPSAPPMVVYSLEAYLYVGDAVAQKTFGTTTVTLKGVGQTETKAYLAAFKMLRPNSPQLQELIKSSKLKIVEYYNSQCDIIIKQAQTLSANNEDEAAVAKLMTIPEECNECYAKVMEATKPIYKKYINRECTVALAASKAAWNSSQDYAGAQKAAEHLGTIDPSAACYAEAQAYSAEIGAQVKKLTDRDWDFQMQLLDLEKQEINAWKEVGVAYGKGQPEKEVVVKGWMY